jgi:hypothetical protein
MAGAMQPGAGPPLLLIWRTRDSDTQVTKIITGKSVRRQVKSAVGAVSVLRASLALVCRRWRGERSMTAQPIHEPAPDDPAEILRRLPLRWHAQFLAEYRAALDAAREVRGWQQLRDLLHRWCIRATAYADPEFEASAQAARDARPEDLAPVPGWADLR